MKPKLKVVWIEFAINFVLLQLENQFSSLRNVAKLTANISESISLNKNGRSKREEEQESCKIIKRSN